MNYKKILLLVMFGFLAFGGTAQALAAGTSTSAVASLVISPAQATKTITDSFNLAAKVLPGGNKVCVVEGNIVLDKLVCRDIKLAAGLTAASMPTCSQPYFLIGIPSCTISDKELFTVTVKPEAIGTSSVSFSHVDLVGEGKSISKDTVPGSYLIKPIVKTVRTVMSGSATSTILQASAGFGNLATDTVSSSDVGNATETASTSNNLAAAGEAGNHSSGLSWLLIAIVLVVLLGIVWLYRGSKPSAGK